MDLAYSDTWAPYNPFHGGSGMCIYKSLGVCAYSLDMCGFLCVAMSDLACRRTHTHHCPSVSHCWESSAMCTHVCTCICICCLILSHDRELYACPKNSTVPFVANSFGMCTNVCVCVCICVFLWWYICVSVYIYISIYILCAHFFSFSDTSWCTLVKYNWLPFTFHYNMCFYTVNSINSQFYQAQADVEFFVKNFQGFVAYRLSSFFISSHKTVSIPKLVQLVFISGAAL